MNAGCHAQYQSYNFHTYISQPTTRGVAIISSVKGKMVILPPEVFWSFYFMGLFWSLYLFWGRGVDIDLSKGP